ncbi:GNAT family N-acetyltransferase [Kitasatospora sp. NPDC002227]|uniref:GNAT family N-acetyltransferase n=1 Tax=Kitasatospora sp. NPDC002227 TaxID=3154773 RepID=UPI00331E14D7
MPEYQLMLPPGWEADASVVAQVEWRRAAAASAGLTRELERLRFEWRRPGAVPPPADGRLRFGPASDEVFRELFASVAVGSLDDFTQRDVARCGISEHARETLDYYRSLPGNRSWWRVARTAEGQLAGFVIPSANDGGPVVGYLGVLPALRGHGLADELVAEATRSHAARGADRVRADTDSLNAPMAAAFLRAGYRVTAARLVLSARGGEG